MSKHTPEPWEIIEVPDLIERDCESEVLVISAGGHGGAHLCEIYSNRSHNSDLVGHEEALANANLFAAAATMRGAISAALQAIVDIKDIEGVPDDVLSVLYEVEGTLEDAADKADYGSRKCRCGRFYPGITVFCLYCNDATPWEREVPS